MFIERKVFIYFDSFTMARTKEGNFRCVKDLMYSSHGINYLSKFRCSKYQSIQLKVDLDLFKF